MSTTYNSSPIVGYPEGRVISDVAPVACTEHFNDNRPSNTNHYFRIEGSTGARYFNVHPYRTDIGGYPIRWIDGFPPVGWQTDDLDLMSVRKSQGAIGISSPEFEKEFDLCGQIHQNLIEVVPEEKSTHKPICDEYWDRGLECPCIPEGVKDAIRKGADPEEVM